MYLRLPKLTARIGYKIASVWRSRLSGFRPGIRRYSRIESIVEGWAMNTVPGRPDPSGRLLLIGNSFDLMHGMSTRWEEF